MRNKDTPELSTGRAVLLYVVPLLLVLAIWVGVWVFKSAMEANAYNRVTNSDVSTWDAMFIELRVQDGPKEK